MPRTSCIAGVTAFGGGLAALALVNSTFAAEGRFEPFVERPGVMEFSGRMTARPLDVVDAIAMTGASQRVVEAEIAAALALIDPYLIHHEPGLNTYTFTLPQGATENGVAAELMATGQFEWVEPDWYVYPVDCPNDPMFNSQWQHDRMESCAAFEYATGTLDIIVATCDTGVNVNHEDLRGRNVPGYNAPDRREEVNGGSISDINGHGTWVTGCYGAIGDNGRGVSGVCQTVSYMPIRVSNSSGGGAYQTDINNGVLWAVNHGAMIANVSYSGAESSSVATLGNQVAAEGAWLVYAGGNEGREINVREWSNDEVVVVSASTSSDRKAGFSNYGDIMDVIAPGSFVRTTDRGGGYADVSGTSFAAPITAGLMALIWSTNPNMNRDEVYNTLIAGVDDLGSSGWDRTYANGRVNSRKSIELIEAFWLTTPAPLIGGSRETFSVANGAATTATGLFYSLRGEGSTFIPALGQSVGLTNAVQAGQIQNTDGAGATSWTLNIPVPPRTVLIWIQALQSSGEMTNVVFTQVNR